MALFDKTDFEGVHDVDTDAKRDWILSQSNNKGNQHFNSMAEFGGTTTTPPLSLAEMKQAYTLDADGVEQVLQAGGLRGHEFLSALTLSGVAAAGTIDTAAGTPGAPAELTLEGLFVAGLTLSLTIEGDPGNVITAHTWVVPTTMPYPVAAAGFAASIRTSVSGISAGVPDPELGTIQIHPVDPPYTDVTVSLFAVS